MLAGRQGARVGDARDQGARRRRDGVLVDLLARVFERAARPQRERAAEGSAKIIALGQFSSVGAEQSPRAWQQRDLDLRGRRQRVHLR